MTETILDKRMHPAAPTVSSSAPLSTPGVWPCLEDRLQDRPRDPSAVERALVWLIRRACLALAAAARLLGRAIGAFFDNPVVQRLGQILMAILGLAIIAILGTQFLVSFLQFASSIF